MRNICKNVGALLLLTAMMVCFFLPNVALAVEDSVECMVGQCDDEDTMQNGEGERQTPSPTQSTKDGPSILWQFIKLISALALIIGLLYALLKFMNKRNKMFHNVKTLQNLGGVSLGQNKSLQVVRIGDQLFAIGVGDNVELLTEITDEKTKRALTEQEANGHMATSSSMGTLFSKRNKQGVDRAQGDNKPSSIQFQQLFQSELKSLQQKRQRLIQQSQKQKEDIDE
ncbi:flagellar biosynthetic protein FliO [Pontibacillus litoralis]|uniref:Flagellar protein n=1 Tax=Pontibacillus litoralis JSM 072002 TaxID=1385512 RepID=A0A0A5G5P1_9BACI|nr:flagellar biosynthetic protein FliO [Pontibacillus litoralis]KGX88436.1 hypothetical protein N784_07155 [Pontibacillus litoralis JSM 072002]